MASGVMPFGILSLGFGSDLRRRVVVICLLVVLHRWEPETSCGMATTIPSIKLLLLSPDRGGTVGVLPPSHRGGGVKGKLRFAATLCRSEEREDGKTAAVFWSGSSVALRRHRVGPPPTLLAEWRLLRALVLATARCHLTFNLQADVPCRRPFICFVAGSPSCITPSGFVPGRGVDAGDLKLELVSGGEGPDCFSLFSFEVLYAMWEDYIVIFTFFEILHVFCKPTVDD